MKQIRDTYRRTGRLHHAYNILGEKESVKKELFSFLEKDLNFSVTANPDFLQIEANIFKVEDSRALIEAHLNKPIKYDRKVFAIFANSLTRGAQNSLLKIFEEPRAEAVFFLVLPESAGLLPTLRSRLIFGICGGEGGGSKAEEFLNAKISKRFEMVNKIVKDIKDEKLKKSDAIRFIKDLEKVMRTRLKLKNAHNARGGSLLALEDIEKAISYANDESPSIKVILEHLVTTI